MYKKLIELHGFDAYSRVFSEHIVGKRFEVSKLRAVPYDAEWQRGESKMHEDDLMQMPEELRNNLCIEKGTQFYFYKARFE